VSAVVTLKKGFKGQISEDELIKFSAKTLPKYAVPVMIIVQNEPLGKSVSF
jgi:hypothetical protein